MLKIIQSRWFAFADLIISLFCALAWAFIPQWGLGILVVALIPWGLRAIAKKSPFRHTILDWPIALFLLTAGIGVWAAYDQAAAMEKFWWIIAACRLYYALAAQPLENFKLSVLIISVVAAFITLQFLQTYNWLSHPLNVGPIDHIGIRWMEIRPELSIPRAESDLAGGLAAILSPLLLVLGVEAWKQKNKVQLGIILVLGSVLTLGLLMSAERPAWLGLMMAAGLWFGWKICIWISKRTNFRAPMIAITGVIALSIVGLLTFLVLWQRFSSYGPIPVRIDELVYGVYLFLDFPLLGGGLTSTSGLFSRYMLMIPYLFIPNIRNQYLNLAIEQGIFGLAAWLLIFSGALWLLIRQPSLEKAEKTEDQQIIYKWGICLGIIILVWHNLSEDVFYSNWGLILMLILPGFAVSLLSAKEQVRVELKRKWLLSGVGLVLLLLIVFFRPLTALWDANLGAIQMAKIQLEGWPDIEWYIPDFSESIRPAKVSFEKSLASKPSNITSLYRMGIIVMEDRDFTTADIYLESAYKANPNHYGIRKHLGYTKLWLGQIEAAETLFAGMQEIPQELEYYSWWWTTQEEEILSDYGNELLQRSQKP